MSYSGSVQKVTSRSTLQPGKFYIGDKPENNVSNTSMNNIDRSYDLKKHTSTSTRCRLGAASIHLRTREVLQFIIIFCILLTLLYFLFGLSPSYERTLYRDVYPLTKSIKVTNGYKYRIGLITDLDHASKVDNSLWRSFLLKGYLIVFDNQTMKVEMDPSSTTLHSSISQGGRGMELSELITFNGELLTVDDRTGIVYKLINEQVVPWVILSDGNGQVAKGFKCEWATVKDGYLYVGGLGKEWTSSTGEVLNFNPQYVKKISPGGSVEHLNWHTVYTSIKNEAGYPSPGYMIHESGVWSDRHKKWYFLPRRASKEKYDDKADEKRATNTLIVCDETFSTIEIISPFGPLSPTHGFSSFKFIPNTNDELILAVRSEEDDGVTASYLTVMDLRGNVLVREILLGDYKYEGVEFI